MPEQWGAFLVVAVVLTVVPGPDTALGLRNSLRGGSTAMWWTGLGVCSGIFVHAGASVLGLSALLAASSQAYAVVKLAGAGYLCWLGASTLWKSWRRSDSGPVPGEFEPAAGRVRRWAAFREGFVSDLLNPKIALLFLTVLPQFISPGEPRTWTSLQLTAVFVLVGLTYWRVSSWLVGSLRQLLSRRRVRLGLERAMGVVMLGFGLRVAVAN